MPRRDVGLAIAAAIASLFFGAAAFFATHRKTYSVAWAAAPPVTVALAVALVTMANLDPYYAALSALFIASAISGAWFSLASGQWRHSAAAILLRPLGWAIAGGTAAYIFTLCVSLLHFLRLGAFAIAGALSGLLIGALWAAVEQSLHFRQVERD